MAENTKVLAARVPQALEKMCTIQECIDRGVITHFPDQCWVKYPEFRAKYSLYHIRTQGSNCSLRKAATLTEPE